MLENFIKEYIELNSKIKINMVENLEEIKTEIDFHEIITFKKIAQTYTFEGYRDLIAVINRNKYSTYADVFVDEKCSDMENIDARVVISTYPRTKNFWTKD